LDLIDEELIQSKTCSQILDNDQLDKHLLYFTIHFFTILYMFRALYAHHQEVESYWCSIWYHHFENKWVV